VSCRDVHVTKNLIIDGLKSTTPHSLIVHLAQSCPHRLLRLKLSLSPFPLSSSSHLLPTHPCRLSHVLPSPCRPVPNRPHPDPALTPHPVFVPADDGAHSFPPTHPMFCEINIKFIVASFFLHLISHFRFIKMSSSRRPPPHGCVDNHVLATTFASSGLVAITKQSCARAILHVPDSQLCT
jgi:hypothetical protein